MREFLCERGGGMASGTKTARRKASRKAKLRKRDKRVKGLLKPIVRRKQLVRLHAKKKKISRVRAA
jgi:hypothetical protein